MKIIDFATAFSVPKKVMQYKYATQEKLNCYS